MKELLEFINQIILEEMPPENTDSNAPFGKWFAPNHRNLDVEEPDTPQESEAIRALIQFMDTSNNAELLSANNGEIANQLYALAKQHKYELVLDPGIPVAYRGIKLEKQANFEEVIRSYKNSITEIVAHDQRNNRTSKISYQELLQELSDSYSEKFVVVKLGTFNYPTRPKRYVKSWTIDKDVALSFMGHGAHRGAMVIKASTAKNKFFGKPGELGKIADFEGEKETISVGDVVADEALVFFSTKPGKGIGEEIIEKYLQSF